MNCHFDVRLELSSEQHLNFLILGRPNWSEGILNNMSIDSSKSYATKICDHAVIGLDFGYGMLVGQ